MQIRNITEKIFTPVSKKTEANKSVANHSNPFGVSFKGNIITADVFESAKKTGFAQQITKKGKLVMNAVIGSMNSFGQSISTRLDSMVSFGRRIRESAHNAINFLSESKLVLNFGNNEKLIQLNLANDPYTVKNLLKKDVSELKTEFTEIVNARSLS